MRYTPSHTAPESRDDSALWFAFRKAELLACGDSGDTALPCCVHLGDHGIDSRRPQYLGVYDGKHCYAVEIDEAAPLPEGWRSIGLRDAFGLLEPTLGTL